MLKHDYGIEHSYADEEVDAAASDSKSGRANPWSEFDKLHSTKGKATIYEPLGPALLC